MNTAPLAFEVRAGFVCRCAYMGPQRLIAIHPEPSLKPPRKLTRRERRAKARAGTQGRRNARPVSVWAPAPFLPVTYRKEIAHAFAFDRGPAAAPGPLFYLYLPDGENPSQPTIGALERAALEWQRGGEPRSRIAPGSPSIDALRSTCAACGERSLPGAETVRAMQTAGRRR